MSDIPNLSSFDPVFFDSDTYGIPPEEEAEELLLAAAATNNLYTYKQIQTESTDYPPDSDEHPDREFEDDLEALAVLSCEQKEGWDRKGVVIRGSALQDGDLNFFIGGDNRRRKVRRERNQLKYSIGIGTAQRSSSLPPGMSVRGMALIQVKLPCSKLIESQIHRRRCRRTGLAWILLYSQSTRQLYYR